MQAIHVKIIGMADLIELLPARFKVKYIDYKHDVYYYAVFNFLYHFSQKLFVTNNAVNFYFYCICGAKFRADLKSLFKKKKFSEQRQSEAVDTISSTI